MNRSSRTRLRAARLLALAPLLALGCSDKSATPDDASVAAQDDVVTTPGGIPANFTRLVALPAAAVGHEANYGVNPAVTFNAAGDPIVAFEWVDPNNDGDAADTTVYFASWNRGVGRFDAPVRVGVAGDVTRHDHTISIAFDTTISVLGIAYSTHSGSTYGVSVGITTEGGRFMPVPLGPSASSVVQPSMGLAHGFAHIAYLLDETANYVTGQASAAPSTWTTTTAAAPPGTFHVAGEASLALDSGGSPAIAYFAPPNTGYNMSVIFWRPGGAQVVAFDSNNQQNDSPHLSLAFHGTSPAIAAQLGRGSGEVSDLYLASSVDGVTWGTVYNVPYDTGANGGTPALALNSIGQGAIVYAPNGGSGSDQCGRPKLARSANLISWTTCSPDANKSLAISPGVPAVGFGADDRLMVVFNNAPSSSAGALGGGLWVWRE